MAQLLVLLLFGFFVRLTVVKSSRSLKQMKLQWLWFNRQNNPCVFEQLKTWTLCVRAISRKQKKLPHPSSCSSNVLSHSCWSWKWTMTRFHPEARVPGNKAETRGNNKKPYLLMLKSARKHWQIPNRQTFFGDWRFRNLTSKKIFDGDLLIGKDCEICLMTCVFVWVCQGFITCLSEVWSGFVGVIYQSTCPAPNKRNGRWSRSPDNKYHNHRMWCSSKMVKYDVGSTTCSFNDIKIILNYPFWCFSEICIDRDRPQS